MKKLRAFGDSDDVFDWITRIFLIAIMLISLFPLLWAVSNSFKTNNEIFASPLSIPDSFHFQYYKNAWILGRLGHAFLASCYTSISTVFIVLLFASLASFPLARMKFRFSKAIHLFIISGMMVANEVVLIPLFHLFKTIHILGNPLAVIFANIAFGLPFAIFLLTGFFKEIPVEIEESTKMDGINSWVFFWRFLIPLSTSVLGSLTIFLFLFNWNDYLFSLTFLIKPQFKTLPIAVQTFFSNHFTDWSLVFASLVISMLPVLILYFILQKAYVKGVVAGAVKG